MREYASRPFFISRAIVDLLDPTGRDMHGETAALRAAAAAARVILPGGIHAWTVTDPDLIRPSWRLTLPVIRSRPTGEKPAPPQSPHPDRPSTEASPSAGPPQAQAPQLSLAAEAGGRSGRLTGFGCRATPEIQ